MKIVKKIKNIKDNFFYRTFFSLLVNLAFALYNSYLGFRYQEPFAIGIAIYYFLLFWVILVTLIVEKIAIKKEKERQTIMRKRNYLISSIFIFVIDFCLIAPIILMVTHPKDVNFGLIPSLVMALHCIYKIVAAIRNYLKSKKSLNLSYILLRQISIIGAIVSILSLQHTLIMVNGGMNQDMEILSLITSISFIILIVIFSIFSFIKNKKIYQN